MDHANSQRAREFLQNYVSGNRKLITDWLDDSGNADQLALGSLGWLGSFTPSSFLWAFSEKHI